MWLDTKNGSIFLNKIPSIRVKSVNVKRDKFICSSTWVPQQILRFKPVSIRARNFSTWRGMHDGKAKGLSGEWKTTKQTEEAHQVKHYYWELYSCTPSYFFSNHCFQSKDLKGGKPTIWKHLSMMDPQNDQRVHFLTSLLKKTKQSVD